MPYLYHITTQAEAEVARTTGEYLPAAFTKESFIHCSYRHQVQQVANAFYYGRADLVLFEINRAGLTSDVVDENLEGGGEQFPHIYGPLPLSAVVRVYPFPCEADGSFNLPSPLSTSIGN